MKDKSIKTSEHSGQNRVDPAMFRGVVRGMLPMYLLSLLRKKPHHGTEIIKAIEKMNKGTWKPSPGSVYPLLKKLEDDGLISGKWVSGRAAATRIYSVTRKGRSKLPGIQKQLLSELCETRDTLQQHIVIMENDLSNPKNDTSNS
jgi:DNA-binding PadR family transcriptional regulator